MKVRNIILSALLLLVPLALLSPGAARQPVHPVPALEFSWRGLNDRQCGGDQSGIRGAYLCDIDQNANDDNGQLSGRELQRRLFCVHVG